MARFRSIHTKFWSDPVVMEISPEAKLIFIFLITNEHLNESGLYPLSLKTISNEIGYDLQIIDKEITTLCNVGKIKYDYENKVVWIVNFFKYQNKSPNCLKSVVSDLKLINSSLNKEFYNTYKGALEGLANPPIGLGLGLGLGNKGVIGGKLKKEIHPLAFDEFYSSYPRKEGKNKALRCWKIRIKEGVKENDLLIAGKNYAKYCEGKEKQYIKLPATFLGIDKPYEDFIKGIPDNGKTERKSPAQQELEELLRRQNVK